ncbi:MAG: hypothetical protein ACPGQR_02585 [Marinirhabdus sp.]
MVSGTTRGAVLRTIRPLIFNEIAVGTDPASTVVNFTIEEQDPEGGDLLQSVDVFATFKDNSPNDGDTSGAVVDEEVTLRTITAAEFYDGPFGLPRFDLQITAGDFYNAFNLMSDDIFGGDTFTTRLALNLTDGRVYSVDNAGGIITGGFFDSPYQYSTPVVCPVEDDEFVGNYTVVSQTLGVLDYEVFDDEGVFELMLGETSVDRTFDYVYLIDAGVGQGPVDFMFQLVCNTIVVPPGQNSGLQCSSGLIIGPAPSGGLGSYTTGDDTTFMLLFTDNSDSDCGEAPKDVEAVFVKQ